MSSNMNNINYNDFKNICRTCMIICDVKFTQDNIISEVFYKLTDIHFETNDELPKQICRNCFQKINEIHAFALQCKQTHFSLTKCLNNIKNKRLKQKKKIIKQTNEPVKVKEEITIEEHKIEFVGVNDFISRNEGGVSDGLKIKEEVKDETTNEEITPETNNDQNINYFQDDLSKPNTSNIQVETEDSCSDTSENNKESSNKSYTCDVCNKTLNHPSSIKRHKILHSGERPYKCDQCSMSFTHSHKLVTHLRTHSGERPYKCEHCSKSFARAIYLTTHVRTHSGERPYKCEQCTKSFAQLITLKVHMRTHSGERLYKCEQCAMSFTQSHNLKVHMRTHSGERPFKCDQCSMSFIQSIHLQRHIYTHSGERPFKCDQCSKSFTQSHNLISHMRSHSSE